MLDKLPDKAREIYEAAWDSAIDKGYDEERAARIAIGAVKNAGYHKDDETGMWAKMHMVHWQIIKATLDEGIMRWHGIVSKFAVDVQGDQITPEFIKYAWNMVQKGHRPAPVVCLSHIDHGKPSDSWVIGDTKEIYVDGKIPKAKGTFRDTPLGKAAFMSVREDIQQDTPQNKRSRFSMGFYDEGSRILKSRGPDGQESTGRRYHAGWIKHLALTRVPVVEETSIEANLEVKGMAKVTKREDAASIVGEELADELMGAAEKADLEDTELILKQEKEEAKEKTNVKTEDGQEFGPGAYLYVPDKESPSTWKLRIEETPGEVTVAQLGRAAAALTKGFRGQKVEMPDEDKTAAGKALIGKYRAEDVSDEDIPEDLWAVADMKLPKKEKSVSLDAFTNRIRDSWRSQFPDSDEAKAPASDYSWVLEVMDDAVIISRNGTLYHASYVVDTETGAIAFGTPIIVQEIKTFVPVEVAPVSTQVPHVATKADLTTNPGATRRDQVKALLGALETLLLEGLDEQADEANRAALGFSASNPPTTVEMSQTVPDPDSDPGPPPAQKRAGTGEPLTPEDTAAVAFVDDWSFRVKAVLVSEWDRTQKFEALQHALNDFGEGVKSLVTDQTPPSGRDMAEVISEAVRRAVEPVYNELAGVKAELAEVLQVKNAAAGLGAQTQPRAMDGRAVVMSEQNLPTSMPRGIGQGTALRHKAMSASELAWQSTAEGNPLRR